jgi:hypothetical protein
MVLIESGPSPRRALGLPVLLAVLATGSATLAQTPPAQGPSAEDRASARVLGTEGIKLADASNCSAAVPKLDAAEKLFHAPTTLDRLGECQIALGQIVAGTENLNRVVREVLPPNAPPAFLAAQKRAQQAYAAAAPRIGTLHIHVDGPPADQVTVTVDGAVVPPALFDNSRPTDPGTHEIKATATGYLATSATAAVKDGSDTSVALHLAPDPAAQAAAAPVASANPAASAAPAQAPAAAPSSGSGGNGLAIGSFVVGGAGIVVGTILGIMALGTKSTLDSNCVNKVCPESQQGNINSLGTQATISTIGFGVGVVGVAVGSILLAVHGGGSSTGAAQVSPYIGVGAAGVGGTF